MVPRPRRLADSLPRRSPLLRLSDLFQQALKVFDGLSHRGWRKQIRIVLRSAEQPPSAIAQFNVEIPPSAAAVYVHVGHTPSRGEWSDVRCDRQRYRKERMAAWVCLDVQ